MSSNAFVANRAEALLRLHNFVPHAGRDYAAGRNSDDGPDGSNQVSKLSPYLRHRLITEREVVAAVLRQHSLTAAEKYVQEVLWRTYWKGWLEMRPDVWRRYCAERDFALHNALDASAIAAAEKGMTGIEGTGRNGLSAQSCADVVCFNLDFYFRSTVDIGCRFFSAAFA
jgi:deoxyribodipyrimidine photo-lyase